MSYITHGDMPRAKRPNVSKLDKEVNHRVPCGGTRVLAGRGGSTAAQARIKLIRRRICHARVAKRRVNLCFTSITMIIIY